MNETKYFSEYENLKKIKKNLGLDLLNLRVKKDFVEDSNGNTYLKDVNIQYKLDNNWKNIFSIS